MHVSSPVSPPSTKTSGMKSLTACNTSANAGTFPASSPWSQLEKAQPASQAQSWHFNQSTTCFTWPCSLPSRSVHPLIGPSSPARSPTAYHSLRCTFTPVIPTHIPSAQPAILYTDSFLDCSPATNTRHRLSFFRQGLAD